MAQQTLYSQTFKRPLWQKRRLQIFERDKWACTKCHSIEKELQVHHLDYIPDIKPWEYPDDMLITLCDECHQKENERPKHEKYLLQSLKMNGFLAADILCLSVLIDRSKPFVHQLKELLRREIYG